MYRVSKLLQQLFCKEFRNGCDIRTGALVSLERRFVGSIEDEDGVDR
jgi:hypothetical protein